MGGAGSEMRELLLVLLRACEAAGKAGVAGRKLGQFLTARYGGVNESKAKLGELQSVRAAFNQMQANLYSV